MFDIEAARVAVQNAAASASSEIVTAAATIDANEPYFIAVELSTRKPIKFRDEVAFRSGRA